MTICNPLQRGLADQRGFALIVVLWVFVVLFAIGAEFAQGMRQDAQAAKNFADETQSYYLAVATANLNFFRALRARDDASLGATPEELEGVTDAEPLPVDGEWRSELMWGAEVWVRLTDESGKLPINRLDQPLLQQIFVNLGLDMDAASGIADSIMDWRDLDDEHRINGAENDYYLGLPRPYLAKNARLDSIEELLLIKGITPDMFYGSEEFPIALRSIFTVFNPRRELNVRNALVEVTQALCGLKEDQAGQVAELPGGKADALQSACGNLAVPQGFLNDKPPEVLTVEVQAKLPSARVSAHIAAVIDIAESAEGVRILRWFDRLAADKVPGSGEGQP